MTSTDWVPLIEGFVFIAAVALFVWFLRDFFGAKKKPALETKKKKHEKDMPMPKVFKC